MYKDLLSVMMPKISIIIATFNAAKTLQTALDSVSSLQMQDWECIIVDGASKDETIEIVRRYANADSRFRYVSEPDKGIYDAFNKGWKMARGEWIHYLGADDRLTPDGFSELLINVTDVPVVSGNVCLAHDDGTLKLNVSKGFGGCHQGKLVKRDLLMKFGGFNTAYRILADKDLFMRMKNGNVPIKNVDVCVAHFALGGVSQNFDMLWERTKENFRIYREDKNTRWPLLKTAYISVRSLLVIWKHKIHR